MYLNKPSILKTKSEIGLLERSRVGGRKQNFFLGNTESPKSFIQPFVDSCETCYSLISECSITNKSQKRVRN